MRPSILPALAALAAALSIVPLARANTLCVHQGGQSCPAGSIDEGSSLQNALGAAGSDGQSTTIDVLAGTYSGGLSLSTEPLVIAGAGAANTIITDSAPVLTLGCAGGCPSGTFAIHDVGIQPTTAGSAALDLSGSFDGHDIAVTAPSATGALTGISLAGTATLERATVVLPQNGAPTTAVSVTGVGRMSDVDLVADVGVTVAASGGATVTRSTIDAAAKAFDSHSGGTAIDDTLIRLTGTGAQIATSIASGLTTSVDVVNSTVIATASNTRGFTLQSEGATQGGHQATASVSNSILWGLSTLGSCSYGAGGLPPALTVTYNDIKSGTTNGNCTPTPTHTLAVTPGYVSASDYHLRYDSPLVDQGDASLTATPGVRDLGGGMRVADGDGNGTAVRDVGAFEYGRRPPAASASAPATATVGQPLTFDASGSFDPDPGETLTYHWDFGDGASASTSVATHAFATTGAHATTASVTDPTGQTTSTTVTVTIPVLTPPAPPTSPTPTTPAAPPTTTATTPKPPSTTASPSGGTTGKARPKLTLSVHGTTIAKLLKGLRVTATLSVPGKVTLTLKRGTRTLVSKRVTFTRAGKRTVVLKLSKKRAASVRHARKLKATLTATLSGAGATKVHKTLLLRP